MFVIDADEDRRRERRALVGSVFVVEPPLFVVGPDLGPRA